MITFATAVMFLVEAVQMAELIGGWRKLHSELHTKNFCFWSSETDLISWPR
jgi:hypothetical protein